MKTKPLIYISSIILISSLFLLVTGSPVLNMPLFKEATFPSGTLVSWIGLIAFTVTIYLIFNMIHNSDSSDYRIFRVAFISIIVLATLWGIIGFLLANNWAFTFQNHDKFRGSSDASRYFWIYTALLVLIPVLLILIFRLVLLSNKLLQKEKRISDHPDKR